MNTTKLKLISQAEVDKGSVKGFPDVVAGDATVLKNAFVKPSSNVAEVMNGNTEALISALSNVDNTSDVDKPISKAVQTAFDGKSTVTVGGVARNAVAFTTDPQTQLDDRIKGAFTNYCGSSTVDMFTTSNFFSVQGINLTGAVILIQNGSEIARIDSQYYRFYRTATNAILTKFYTNGIVATMAFDISNAGTFIIRQIATYGSASIIYT